VFLTDDDDDDDDDDDVIKAKRKHLVRKCALCSKTWEVDCERRNKMKLQMQSAVK